MERERTNFKDAMGADIYTGDHVDYYTDGDAWTGTVIKLNGLFCIDFGGNEIYPLEERADECRVRS